MAVTTQPPPSLPSSSLPPATTGLLRCEADIALHSFEELLCVTRKGAVEKFEVSGTLKLSASPLRAAGAAVEGGGVAVVQLVVSDAHRSIAALLATTPPSPLCAVTVTPAGSGAHGATATATVTSPPPSSSSLSSSPQLPLLPVLSYRAAPSFRPELVRARAVVTLPVRRSTSEGAAGGGGAGGTSTTVSVAIQVMLNTKFNSLLENVQVMASLAPLLEAAAAAAAGGAGADAGGDPSKVLLDVKSRPASGVYSASSRVLSWDCGSHRPSSSPVLKMEAQLALALPPSSPSPSLPTSIPVIVKALLSAPLLVDCSVEVRGATVTLAPPPHTQTQTQTQAPLCEETLGLSPVTKHAKSKVEYRIL